ncbi:MAG: serine/threonine-protein kinase, partial [Dokdonella sp.]
SILDFARESALDLPARLRLMVSVCRAVEAAHRALIVHRDLKPSNVLVTAEGIVKLLDFGIAKLLDQSTDEDGTQTQHKVMTPAYAAPEQFSGGQITTATDVYALGLLLNELITGRRREHGDLRTPSSRVTDLPDDMLPAPPAALRRELRGDLDNIVLKATAVEPDARYVSAGALADDIECYLANRPVAAHPPSSIYRLRKFIARHRGGVIVAIAVLLVCAIALGFALAQARVAYRAAQRADAMREFMFKAFAEAEPSGPRDGAPRITDVVTQAVANAKADVRMNPQVRTELVGQLGAILRAQGQVAPAREIHALNFAQSQRDFGERDALTIEAGHELAQSMIFAGAFQEARPFIDGLLARVPGDHPRLAADLRFDSALLATKQHDRQRALDDANTGIDLARSIGDVDVLGRALDDVGNVQLELQDFSGATKTYTELLAQKQQQFGPVHADVAAMHASLSRAYRRAGDTSAAESHIRAALSIDAKVLPKDDWRISNHLNALMFVLMTKRDFSGALEAAAESLRIDRLAYGDAHPEVANDLNSVGMLRGMLGDYAGAREPLRESLRLSRAIWGETNSETALGHSNYGVTLVYAGDIAEGEAEIHRALDLFAAAAAPDFDQMATTWEKVARIELDRHQPAAALVAIAHVDDTLRKIPSIGLRWNGRIALLRANAALQQGDWSQTLSLLVAAEEGLHKSPHADAELVVETGLLRAIAMQRGDRHDGSGDAAAAALAALANLRNPPQRLRTLAASLSDETGSSAR